MSADGERERQKGAMTSMDVRVAVVDGERFFRDAICEILDGAGFACAEAEDAATALALCSDESIGVAVLDLELPGADGLDVLRGLHESRPDLRVLVVSASMDQETVLEALRIGACDYLAKPLHDEELVLAVRRAAEGHQLVAESTRLGRQLHRLASLCTMASATSSRSAVT